MKRLYVSAGEPSGDLYARRLVQTWSAREPLDVRGMAGLTAGLPACRDNAQLQIMGFSGVLRQLPALLALKNAMAREIMELEPHLVCLIDSPDFHLPLLKTLRRLGYKEAVAYLCPPTVWAWRSGRAKVLARHVQLALPLFDFEARALQAAGVNAPFEGHPLLDAEPEAPEPERNPRAVALLPGSRRGEVRALLPVLRTVADGLRLRGYEPVLSQAPGLSDAALAAFEAARGDLPVYRGSARRLLGCCGFAVGASGTVATEALLARCPMAVLYQGSVLERAIFRLFVKTPYVSVPNLLAEGEIFPEFLGADCTAEKVLRWVDGLPQALPTLRRRMECARRRLGRPGVMERWVDRLAAL